MKVIDLLNKIANGEEAPKEIYYKNQWWEYNPKNDYEGTGYGGCFLNHVLICDLNDEVEIIQYNYEDFEIDNNGYIHTKAGSWKGRKLDIELVNKINELEKVINELKNKED